MDLYDDIDISKPRTGSIDGWSSGIKMLQTQIALKKAQVPNKLKETKKLMTPLRTKKIPINDESVKIETAAVPIIATNPLMENVKPDEWDFVDEYDPQRPNEFEKLKEKHQSRDKGQRDDRSRNRNDDRNERKRGRGGNRKNSSPRTESPPTKFSGFGGRERQSEEDRYSPPAPGSVSNKGGGAAIAPPPSLQEFSIANESGDGSSNVTIPYSASSVAAKIMAKYGFKDGQGLGKQEQGMSIALQVEKTSKRGGRIIHEKDVFLPPDSLSPPTAQGFMPPPALIPPLPNATAAASALVEDSEPSITEIMKTPSKVVLLKNMVGPGDVDEDLEPEVKDECNTKYGDVVSVVIHEAFGTIPEEAVKIYVEFKRIESAIKAVVDLNGRFFGGRQVRAGFYNFDKFKSFQLS